MPLPPDTPPPERRTFFKKGWKTYAIGVAGIVFSVLSGADWEAIFSGRYAAEWAGVAAGGIILGRALVALFRAMGDHQND